jgi:hypothetical protein
MWEGLVVKGASTTSHKCQHQREGRHRKLRRSEPRDDGDRYGLEGELEGVRKNHRNGVPEEVHYLAQAIVPGRRSRFEHARRT